MKFYCVVVNVFEKKTHSTVTLIQMFELEMNN